MSAITAEIKIKNTISIRIVNTFFFSDIPFAMVPSIISKVSTELEVNTKDDKVDIDADNTSITTTAIKRSGRSDSIDGMIESYIGAPVNESYSITSPNNLPKPPKK